MAAISFIAGSLLGWAAAACALIAGTLLSTALIIFLATSLGSTGLLLFVASRHSVT